MSKMILFGTLRRDVMVLGVFDSDDDNDPAAEATKAVEQGRAQTAFTVLAESFASASDVNWGNPDTHTVGRTEPASSVPALNPATGGEDDPRHDEQEVLDESDAAPVTSIRENIVLEANAGAKGPNTGANPDSTPTDPATLGKVPGSKETDAKAAIDANVEKTK